MAALFALALQPGLASSEVAPSQQAEAAPQVAAKWAEPAHAVYLEFTGPYWRVGRAFRQVRVYMLEHKLEGPLFIRYPGPTAPDAAGTDEARMEVGFICAEPHEPVGPFRQQTWERQFVAYLDIEGVVRQTEPQRQLLQAWAREHEHRSLGTLTEIYHPAPMHTANSTPRTEIRLALAEPAPSTDGKAEEITTTEPKPSEPAPPPAAEQQQEQAPPLEPIRPIAELLAEGEYDRIAEQVIRSEQPWTQELRLWWNQAAFRLSAIANAVEQVHGQEDPAVSGLINAVTDRYHAMAQQVNRERPNQKVERAEAQPVDPQRTARRRLLRDLDALLERITLKLADPQAVAQELAEFLESAQQLDGAPEAPGLTPATAPEAQPNTSNSRIGAEERQVGALCCGDHEPGRPTPSDVTYCKIKS